MVTVTEVSFNLHRRCPKVLILYCQALGPYPGPISASGPEHIVYFNMQCDQRHCQGQDMDPELDNIILILLDSAGAN